MTASAHQVSLFGRGQTTFDSTFRGLQRTRLDPTAWVDHLPGWVDGHEALFDTLRHTTAWRSSQRQMYERVVDVPRLLAGFPKDGPGHPILPRLADALSDRYGWALQRISAACYRDGRDSVALHADKVGPLRPDCVIAIVSVGEPRKFVLRRPGGPSRRWHLGWGDLLVMGGSCQRDWQHGIPKVASAGPRISIMFRPGPPRPAQPDFDPPHAAPSATDGSV